MKKILGILIVGCLMASCTKWEDSNCKEYTYEWEGSEKVILSESESDATEAGYLHYETIISPVGDTTYVHHYVECN